MYRIVTRIMNKGWTAQKEEQTTNQWKREIEQKHIFETKLKRTCFFGVQYKVHKKMCKKYLFLELITKHNTTFPWERFCHIHTHTHTRTTQHIQLTSCRRFFWAVCDVCVFCLLHNKGRLNTRFCSMFCRRTLYIYINTWMRNEIYIKKEHLQCHFFSRKIDIPKYQPPQIRRVTNILNTYIAQYMVKKFNSSKRRCSIHIHSCSFSLFYVYVYRFCTCGQKAAPRRDGGVRYFDWLFALFSCAWNQSNTYVLSIVTHQPKWL